jgi:hypothetical protein
MPARFSTQQIFSFISLRFSISKNLLLISGGRLLRRCLIRSVGERTPILSQKLTNKQKARLG